MAVWKIFVGGGGDTKTEIVKSYQQEYARLNPQFECRYFIWDDGGDLNDLLNGDARDGSVSLVGHSFGGDTAFWRMGKVPKVDLLVSIDPVASFQRSWSSIRAGAKVWLNVRAEPDWDHSTTDEVIAFIGGKYGTPPAPGQPNAPNYSYTANCTHGDFRGMMRKVSGRVSARQLLGGRSVA